MQTIDEITIYADPNLIYEVAADIEHWPNILPHYRWVRLLGTCEDGCIVEMAALRDGFPVKWTAVQKLDPVNRRVYYRHIGGATRGMAVEWSITVDGDSTMVRIIHDLTLETPIISSSPGKWIVANVFVRRIAGQTLSRLKSLCEQSGSRQ